MALRVASNYLRLSRKTYRIITTLAYHARSQSDVGLYNVHQHSITHRENRVILQGRYCDGELADAFESGLLTAICRRAAQLESEIGEGKDNDGPAITSFA